MLDLVSFYLVFTNCEFKTDHVSCQQFIRPRDCTELYSLVRDPNFLSLCLHRIFTCDLNINSSFNVEYPLSSVEEQSIFQRFKRKFKPTSNHLLRYWDSSCYSHSGDVTDIYNIYVRALRPCFFKTPSKHVQKILLRLSSLFSDLLPYSLLRSQPSHISPSVIDIYTDIGLFTSDHILKLLSSHPCRLHLYQHGSKYLSASPYINSFKGADLASTLHVYPRSIPTCALKRSYFTYGFSRRSDKLIFSSLSYQRNYH